MTKEKLEVLKQFIHLCDEIVIKAENDEATFEAELDDESFEFVRNLILDSSL